MMRTGWRRVVSVICSQAAGRKWGLISAVAESHRSAVLVKFLRRALNKDVRIPSTMAPKQ